MLDAVGNVLMENDIVMVALGASRNRNNSSLTPCRIIEISGNRCRIETCNEVVTKHKKMNPHRYIRSYGRGYKLEYTCWKFPRQVVKIEKYITKI